MANRQNNISVRRGTKGFEGKDDDATGALKYIQHGGFSWSQYEPVSYLCRAIEIVQQRGTEEQWSAVESRLDMLKKDVDIHAIRNLPGHPEAMDFDETILYRFGDRTRTRTDTFEAISQSEASFRESYR